MLVQKNFVKVATELIHTTFELAWDGEEGNINIAERMLLAFDLPSDQDNSIWPNNAIQSAVEHLWLSFVGVGGGPRPDVQEAIIETLKELSAKWEAENAEEEIDIEA